MLIDKERLILCLRDSIWDPIELRAALITVDEQPPEESVDEFIGRFNQEIIKLCDPDNRADDVIEIRGRLFIRIPTIGRLLIECVKRKDGK